MVNFGVHHLPLPGGAPAPKNRGSLPPPTPLPCGVEMRRARRGTRRPTPYGALPQRTQAIRANPRLMRISRHNLHHNGEGFAL